MFKKIKEIIKKLKKYSKNPIGLVGVVLYKIEPKLYYFLKRLCKQNKIDPSFPIECLRVYDTKIQKTRIGKDNDGGYVILDGFSYDFLVGCGISDDNSFEIEFVEKYQVNCHAFDGSVSALPTTHPQIKFFKKNISDKNNASETNLHELIKEYDNIFLKMDIEGGEYSWIHSLDENQLNKFRQIAIEFHTPFTKEKWDCINKINKTHYMCHFHPNNCSDISVYGDIEVPDVFECTFIRKKDIEHSASFNRDSLPSDLDMKNTLSREDIIVKGYPYIEK